MKEEWRDIKGFEGKYMVSNLGRVKSLNYRRTGKEKIMEGIDNGYGYLFVNLYRGGKSKQCLVHRLVATAFCENPSGYTELNHIDENKQNNRADNLEYCSRSYNLNYGTRNKKVAEKLRGRKQTEEHIKKRSKPVFSVDKESGLIMWWASARDAERQTGINNSNIIQCCKGKIKSAGGHVWFYAD